MSDLWTGCPNLGHTPLSMYFVIFFLKHLYGFNDLIIFTIFIKVNMQVQDTLLRTRHSCYLLVLFLAAIGVGDGELRGEGRGEVAGVDRGDSSSMFQNSNLKQM